MSDHAKSVSVYGLQGQIRRSIQHARSFQVEPELPKAMRDKLAQLDQAVASRAHKPR